MRIFGTSCLCGAGDEIINYDRVDAFCVLLCHQIMDNLQHWPIERSGVVEAEILRWIQRSTQCMFLKVVLALSP